MKIVYDYQVFFQEYGGASRYIYEVASNIAKIDGFDVKILAFIYANKYLRNCDHDLVIGLPVPIIPKTAMIANLINKKMTKLLLKKISPDVVHETYYLEERLAPKTSKVVVTVLDMIHEKFNKNSLMSRDCWIKAKSVMRADSIICISENTKKDLIEILNVTPQKISVIYLGSSLKQNANSELSKVKLHHPYILYVGNRVGYKNFQGFLRAYASSQNMKNDFKVVCFGARDFSREELKLIHELGLSRKNVIHISEDDNTLASLYENSSAFVYPSLYEGFGIPPLEAMSFCCPVICSNTGSIPEIVSNSAEFFNPHDPDSIMNAMERVLYSSERAENLVKLGLERVKHFSWEKCAEQTRQLYLSLV